MSINNLKEQAKTIWVAEHPHEYTQFFDEYLWDLVPIPFTQLKFKKQGAFSLEERHLRDKYIHCLSQGIQIPTIVAIKQGNKFKVISGQMVCYALISNGFDCMQDIPVYIGTKRG